MDIVFALLLLFGGFALGSVTAERDPSVHHQPSVAEDRSKEPPGLTTSDPLICHGGKAAVIYRDLTLSHPGPDGPTQDACWRVCGKLPG